MKILSPYTVTQKEKKRNYILLLVIIGIALIGIVAYIFISNQNENDFIKDKVSYQVSYRIGE